MHIIIKYSLVFVFLCIPQIGISQMQTSHVMQAEESFDDFFYRILDPIVQSRYRGQYRLSKLFLINSSKDIHQGLTHQGIQASLNNRNVALHYTLVHKKGWDVPKHIPRALNHVCDLHTYNNEQTDYLEISLDNCSDLPQNVNGDLGDWMGLFRDYRRQQVVANGLIPLTYIFVEILNRGDTEEKIHVFRKNFISTEDQGKLKTAIENGRLIFKNDTLELLVIALEYKEYEIAKILVEALIETNIDIQNYEIGSSLARYLSYPAHLTLLDLIQIYLFDYYTYIDDVDFEYQKSLLESAIYDLLYMRRLLTGQ